MLIRVRSNVGVWRVDNLDEDSATVNDVMEGIAATRPDIVYEKQLSRDPACSAPLDPSKTLSEQKLGHGSMIHCRVDPATCAESSGQVGNMKKTIGKDGNIAMVHDTNDKNGFRKGMMPLRDMKMQWTLNDFMVLDSQYEFKIKRQESAVCTQVSLDTTSVGDFQTYLRRFNFQRQRVGFLYGSFEPENKVKVEAIYEPPQEIDSEQGFVLLDDENEERVENLAEMLGLKRVGWIVGHPPREDGFVLSANEVILAAELQLEAAGGIDEDTPFVTVKVTVADDGNVSVEAFQVSKQCMTMVAEEALETGNNPGFCVVNDTFTAIQEGKPSKTVENNFFLAVVPIVQHNSDTFVAQFPKSNRDMDDRVPSKDELKRQLSKSGSAGWAFCDLLSDFNLLIYLQPFLESDMPKVCEAIVAREIPEGYKIIIASIAGMDGSY